MQTTYQRKELMRTLIATFIAVIMLIGPAIWAQNAACSGAGCFSIGN